MPPPRQKAVPRRRARIVGKSPDVVVRDLLEHQVGAEIQRRLELKGFCVVDPGIDLSEIRSAIVELKEYDALGKWQRVNNCIQRGLLGPEGSSYIAEMESEDLDEDVRADGASLRALNSRITDLAWDVTAAFGDSSITHKTHTVVHQAGELDDERTFLTEKTAHKYLSHFVRHKVMVILFLGPTGGALELSPYHTEDAFHVEVPTTPGTMVVVRPDLMSHEHYGAGRSFAMSTFCLVGHLPRLASDKAFQMTPPAAELDRWILERLKQLKQNEREDAVWDNEIPREWKSSMNHLFHRGQMIAVRGLATKFPRSEAPDVWWQAGTAGPDFAVEVPMQRWDHGMAYDDDPESYKWYKSNCKHAAFVDGIDLFDCRLFGLTPNEAKAMDPHQRLILEVGYMSLHNMGQRKMTLVNAACGVYVGCGNSEWNMAEKSAEFGAFGATGGALSISSGRFSFTLGLKGPSMTLDTEAASGATATYLAAESCQSKGRAPSNDLACAISASLLLTPALWPSACAAGWLCPQGRCFTFDASAAGYIRGDGVAAVCVKPLAPKVDGKVAPQEVGEPLYGSIAGAMMLNNGRNASLAAPSGHAEQETMIEAIRNASIVPADVTCVEAHGSGQLLHDAVEVGSLVRAHRCEDHRVPIAITGAKSSLGNQVETGAMASFIKSLISISWGTISPVLHLRQVNPHTDCFQQPCYLLNECTQYDMPTVFAGVMARGLGGANVYTVTWGQIDSKKLPPLKLAPKEMAIAYWPGGGGALAPELCPVEGYRIIGSWSQWTEMHLMEPDGQDAFAFTMTLGENRWEQFQIWLDGDPSRALHPGVPKAPKESPVYGPDEGAHGLNWHVEGRERSRGFCFTDDSSGWAVTSMAHNPGDRGRPGDQYRIRLNVVGKWRSVTWERVNPKRRAEDSEIVPAVQAGTYYVAASWSEWEPLEMNTSPDQPGLHYLDVDVPKGGEFQIVRNKDWNQVIYPEIQMAPCDGSAQLMGPDDMGDDMNWYIDSSVHQRHRIEFRRVVDGADETASLTWRPLGTDESALPAPPA